MEFECTDERLKKKIKSEGGYDTREYRQTKRLRSRRTLPVGCKGCERIRRINIPPPPPSFIDLFLPISSPCFIDLG